MATSSLGDELLGRLNALFREDPAIDEIGLLFGIEAEDLSVDTAFMLAEHKLGVAFSAGPAVFRAARTRFHELNAQLHSGAIADEDSSARDELLACTRAVLLICADFYTAWNTRKNFVRRGWLKATDEVTFTNLVFTLHPKSIDTWAYRRWLATLLVEQWKQSDAQQLEVFFQAQVELCAVLTERFPRNYHAWSFRHWIVSRFASMSQLEQELAAMQRWCETHLTDNSGWNHRQHTIKCLLAAYGDTREPKLQRLLAEFEFLSGILSKYPMHEALWCHRRFVMQELLNQYDDIGSDGLVDALNSALKDVVSIENNERVDWLADQWKQVQEFISQSSTVGASMVKDIAIAWRCGNRFARRFAAWLLQRLQTKSSLSFNELNHLMRISLSTEDALLEHLWKT